MKTVSAVAAVTLGAFFLYHHMLLGKSVRIQQTLGYREFAGNLRRTLGEQFPVVHVDTPFAVQFYLNTARPLTSFERAANLLQGNFPAFVSVSDFDTLVAQFPTNAPILREVARSPGQGIRSVRVVSNQLSAGSPDRLATIIGPFRIQLEHLKFVRMRDNELILRPGSEPGVVSISNESLSPQLVRVRCLTGANKNAEEGVVPERTLAPAETWNMAF